MSLRKYEQVYLVLEVRWPAQFKRQTTASVVSIGVGTHSSGAKDLSSKRKQDTAWKQGKQSYDPMWPNLFY